MINNIFRYFYTKQFFLWVTIRTFFWSRLFKKFGKNSFIFGRVNIFYPENVTFGNYSALDEGVILNARAPIEIGNHVHVSPGAFVTTGSMNVYQKYPNRQRILKPIKIGSGTWIAAQAIIFPGVNIGENVVVSANSVVNKDIPDNAIVSGSPAKIVAYLPYKNETKVKSRSN